MTRIAILGSTGSIGKSTLDVVRRLPGKFSVVALSTNSKIDMLYEQIKEFRPAFVCVKKESAALKLKSKLNSRQTRILAAEEGLEQLVENRSIEKIVLAISGSGALLPLLKAIDNGKEVALANKEALVMAGPIIMQKAKKQKARILPIDSEQSAIWQCLEGHNSNKLKNIYLTASGGPFRRFKPKDMRDITVARVLRHPRWKMGKKITVDSATLMNKGLEVLEAMYLFGLLPRQIKILIHPEALIHSMVEFIDGVVLAQLSITDMRIPIQYALSYPERFKTESASIDFCKLKSLNFERIDFGKFPCLRLAYEVANRGGTLPAVLNAANEVSVEQFLKRKLRFIFIPTVVEKVLARHKSILRPGINDILEADSWARIEAQGIISKRGWN